MTDFVTNNDREEIKDPKAQPSIYGRSQRDNRAFSIYFARNS
jgi:hypothetical protein